MNFHARQKDLKLLTYQDYYNRLISDSTEFTAAYTRTFNRLGVETSCIILNDKVLLEKMKQERAYQRFTTRELLKQEIKDFRPDVLWLEDPVSFDPDLVSYLKEGNRSIKLVAAYHCSSLNPSLIRNLSCADIVIACTPWLKAGLEKNGHKAYLVYHGFDNGILPGIRKGNNSGDIVFAGSLFLGADSQNNRLELLETLLKSGVDIRLYLNLDKRYKILAKQIIYRINQVAEKIGIRDLPSKYAIFADGKSRIRDYSYLLLSKARKPLFGMEMYNLISNSGVVLNMHAEGSAECAGNMRLFEVTGIGSCLLTDYKRNIRDLFIPGEEIVTYTDTEDCISKIQWLLRNDVSRRKIAEAGQKRTLKDHTIENRCREIVGILSGELSKS
jgi:hypothetical protein